MEILWTSPVLAYLCPSLPVEHRPSTTPPPPPPPAPLPSYSVLGCSCHSGPVGPLLFQLCFSVSPPTLARLASLPLPLWVTGQGLACGAGCWLPEGVSDVVLTYLLCVPSVCFPCHSPIDHSGIPAVLSPGSSLRLSGRKKCLACAHLATCIPAHMILQTLKSRPQETNQCGARFYSHICHHWDWRELGGLVH